jgi:hypothetical protein
VNLPRMEAKLQQLALDFRWGRMDTIFLPRAAAAELKMASSDAAALA